MPHVNFAVPSDEVMAPGHLGCAGCGGTLAMRLALKALGRQTVLVVPACCWSVIDGPAPFSAAGVPLMHTPFASAAAAASGVRAGLDLKGDTATTVCAWAGDGGTFDIGLQALSAAAERNENILYICYDNEAYMNTGVQRSSATPFGAWTTTTPSQHVKDRPKKDIVAIMVAHGIPYAATATVAYPEDLDRQGPQGRVDARHALHPPALAVPPGLEGRVRGVDSLRAPRGRVARVPAVRGGRRTAVAAHGRTRGRVDRGVHRRPGAFPPPRRQHGRDRADQAQRRRALAGPAGADTVTMHTILSKDTLSADVVRFWVEAPAIARKRRPGQFVIVRSAEGGERIPLTIADADPSRGAISLVVQAVGTSTMKLNRLEPGDAILDVAGPLGQPTRIAPGSRVCCIGGGIGTAVAFPIAAGVKAEGGHVVSIIGARTRDLVILEDEMATVAGESLVYTDDGSHGVKGLVTDALKMLLDRGETFDEVVAVGPLPMMRAVCEVTRPIGLKTIVSLNPIMVDGTGMCGGCRVTVGGEQKFVCVDGPEFDGHLVDFAELSARLKAYREDEAAALELYRAALAQ